MFPEPFESMVLLAIVLLDDKKRLSPYSRADEKVFMATVFQFEPVERRIPSPEAHDEDALLPCTRP